MKNRLYFISGINTHCGKTHITGLLAERLANEGIKVITQKPVQTGSQRPAEDIVEHRRLMGCDMFPEDTSELTSSYVFDYPASPHLAAQLEHTTIDPKRIKADTDELLKRYDVVLTEGAGGLFVPLLPTYYTIDYIKEYKYPLILVSSSRLGSINHTILSLEACRNYDINLHTVIYNHFPEVPKEIAEDSYMTIEGYLKQTFPHVRLLHLYDLIDPIIDIERLF